MSPGAGGRRGTEVAAASPEGRATSGSPSWCEVTRHQIAQGAESFGSPRKSFAWRGAIGILGIRLGGSSP